jgi:hypothetical protein
MQMQPQPATLTQLTVGLLQIVQEHKTDAERMTQAHRMILFKVGVEVAMPTILWGPSTTAEGCNSPLAVMLPHEGQRGHKRLSTIIWSCTDSSSGCATVCARYHASLVARQHSLNGSYLHIYRVL